MASDTKLCSKCGIEYPATVEYFYKHKTCKYGLMAECKRCFSGRMYHYEKAHPEMQREKKSRYKKVHAKRVSEQNKHYNRNHTQERRAYNRQRRIRRRNAPGIHTAADIQVQLKRQKGRCYYAACGHAKLGDKYHVEHVVPLDRGGWNDPSNIVISCPSCNLSKHTKLPHEWPEGGRLL